MPTGAIPSRLEDLPDVLLLPRDPQGFAAPNSSCGTHSKTDRPELEGTFVQVLVRDNNVDQALKALKKKMQREGIFREMKLRGHYEKPSEKKARRRRKRSAAPASSRASVRSAKACSRQAEARDGRRRSRRRTAAGGPRRRGGGGRGGF